MKMKMKRLQVHPLENDWGLFIDIEHANTDQEIIWANHYLYTIYEDEREFEKNFLRSVIEYMRRLFDKLFRVCSNA